MRNFKTSAVAHLLRRTVRMTTFGTLVASSMLAVTTPTSVVMAGPSALEDVEKASAALPKHSYTGPKSPREGVEKPSGHFDRDREHLKLKHPENSPQPDYLSDDGREQGAEKNSHALE